MNTPVPPPSGSTSPLAFPGATLAGRYRLDEVVGHGGMGSVWRATHLGLGEHVAVKLVSSQFARSPEALRRFDTEAKAAARLRSRHVPQVFDNGVLEDGTPFLVMELLGGESLAARLGRSGTIPLREAVFIVEQCGRALARAHSLGIVHRDIKPENVYLAQSVDDDGYIVKVLDFGIAKVTSATDGASESSTRTGALLGTPLYMSPEQARGLRSMDHRTDLYSLGLVTYTMLTGRMPFGGESLGELLLQICAEPLPSLRALAPDLPPAMEVWFQRACARQPEDRFASAPALVEALRVAAGLSSSAPVDSAPETAPEVASNASGAATPAMAETAAAVSSAIPPARDDGARVTAITAARGPRRVALASSAVGIATLVVALGLGVSAARKRGVPAGAPAWNERAPSAAAPVVGAGEGAATSVEPAASLETRLRPDGGAAPTAVLASPPSASPPEPAASAASSPAAPSARSRAPSSEPPRSTPNARRPARPSGAIDLGY